MDKVLMLRHLKMAHQYATWNSDLDIGHIVWTERHWRQANEVRVQLEEAIEELTKELSNDPPN